MPSAAPARDRWGVLPAALESELKSGRIPKEQVCLGCAAKADLVRVVYPALKKLKREIPARSPVRFEPRDDVYVFETDGEVRLDRRTYPLSDLAALESLVARDVRAIRAQGVVLLASFGAQPLEEEFRSAMGAFLRGASETPSPLSVGKGHTIQISKTPGERFLLADFLSFKAGGFFGVANNDTISRVDPNLPHASWVAVFIALNNALNDLFLNGVWKGIEVHPTFDSPDPSDLPRIREAFERYAERMRPIGLEFRDAPPIGFGTKAIGATAIGLSAREIPRNSNLREGQIILATRPVGDLAPLTEVLIRQASLEDASAFEGLRRRVLSEMLLPNVEAAQIIESHLPMKGEPFDSARHVTCARDMSGPGLLALEELAEDSGVDIYLHDVCFHDDRLADTPMDNPTSGTNGAILLAADEGLHERLARSLAAAGCRPWIAGRVLGRTDSPSIEENERLRRFCFLRASSRPFFSRARFVPARGVPSLPAGLVEDASAV
ncbi:MAG: SelD-related putative sulfur metabolism protein [Planctomycetota bacterium]